MAITSRALAPLQEFKSLLCGLCRRSELAGIAVSAERTGENLTHKCPQNAGNGAEASEAAACPDLH